MENREYTTPIKKKDHLYTIEAWEEIINDGGIMDEDGFGYWVKDGYASRDKVFETTQLDATHVVWYNK